MTESPTQDTRDDDTPPDVIGNGLIRWPPPGLERLQGDAWLVVRGAALASLILVLPLLLTISETDGFATLGPLGGAWWVILISTAVGLALALEAWATLFRLLRRGAKAVDRGYQPGVIARVAADSMRDTGFLIQGVRWYSTLSEDDRRLLSNLRVTGAALNVGGMSWTSLGFSISVLMAARGALTPTTMVWFTLGPGAVLVIFGALIRAVENTMVRRARAAWFKKPWVDDLETEEVREWSEEVHSDGDASETLASGATRLRIGAFVVAILATLSLAAPMLLVPTSAIGPVLTAVAVPRFARTQQRAAEFEAYRGYGAPSDSTVTQAEAGRLLHELIWVGRSAEARPVPLENAPQKEYPDPFIPPDRFTLDDVIAPRWGETFIPGYRSLPPETLEILRTIASHPALESFSRLATARGADIASARWDDFSGAGFGSIPVPRYAALREGAYAMVATAILQLRGGKVGAAEQTLRGVVSVGFLLVDDGPMIVDNLVGLEIVRTGGEALQTLFAVTRQTAEEEAIRAIREATGRASRQIHDQSITDLEGSLTRLPPLAMDEGALRGLRWEAFVLTNTLVPCLNLNGMVFGPGDEYESWVQNVRSSLVRWPGEEQMFQSALSGYFGSRGLSRGNGGAIGRILGMVMRGGDSPGSCAALFQRASQGI
jgi:hypothetical protein